MENLARYIIFKEVNCNPKIPTHRAIQDGPLRVGWSRASADTAESKKILVEQKDVPFITIRGRKGGSALAACVVNQLTEVTLSRQIQ